MTSQRHVSRARFPLLSLGLVALVFLTGCAGTGVSARSVEDFAGAITDAELYRQAKIDSDTVSNENLTLVMDKLAAVDAELQLVKASTDGKIDQADALAVVRDMHDGLKAARKKLAEIRTAQQSADLHFHSQVALMRAALSLLRALADRDQAAADANAATVESIKKASGIIRSTALAGAGVPIPGGTR